MYNDYAYSDKVCPICGAWDCCEIEYEKIDSALKRKKKIDERSKN